MNQVQRSVEPVLRKRQSEVSESESTLCDPEIQPVLFYREQESWGIFSNYWKGNPLKFQGLSCATSEHFFQALKAISFSSYGLFENCMILPSAADAGSFAGQNLNNSALQNGWFEEAPFATLGMDQWKAKSYIDLTAEHFNIMHYLNGSVVDYQGDESDDPDLFSFTKQDAAMLLTLRLKGESNNIFKKELQRTGANPIIENTKEAQRIDYVWGNGPNGCGQNRLGLALMIYRAEIRGEIQNILSNNDLFALIQGYR